MESIRAKRQLSNRVQTGKVVPLLKPNILGKLALDPTRSAVESSNVLERGTTLSPFTTSVITREQVTQFVHEMRSPLSVILNVLSACQKTQRHELEQERLTLALAEAERLHRLAEEILAQARCELKPTFGMKEVNLWDLIREVINLTNELAVAVDRQIILVSSFPNITVRGDRDKLKQVFLNLLINACEASYAGQVVAVRCQLDLETHQVFIKIHNEGKPIPTPLRSLLGYQQITTKGTGNGLGLIIVREIVVAHGGAFEIESSGLSGTTAQISLPIACSV
jgi:signal transduction histidine kinase